MQNITEPLRLAIGPYPAGSGRGCAMNVISWENGDTEITAFPRCADPMLARVVQRVNDTYCAHTQDGLLCPECSMAVLALAHRTVGTALDLPAAERAAVAAYTAAYEVACDAYADAAYDAYDAYDYADKASAYAAIAAVIAANQLDRAHRLIDRFEELTGVRAQPVPDDVTREAVAAMSTRE